MKSLWSELFLLYQFRERGSSNLDRLPLVELVSAKIYRYAYEEGLLPCRRRSIWAKRKVGRTSRTARLSWLFLGRGYPTAASSSHHYLYKPRLLCSGNALVEDFVARGACGHLPIIWRSTLVLRRGPGSRNQRIGMSHV